MTDHVRVAIVGGGVIGTAIAHAFARAGVDDVVVIEAQQDVGEGASKANSAIVHTGFDSTPGTIESAMLRRSAELWPEFIDELAVPFIPVGALMIARGPEEVVAVRGSIRDVATGHGVRTELVEGAELRDLAPYVAESAAAGLLIPDEGVIDPFWLTRAYAEAAMTGGAAIARGVAVTGLSVSDQDVRLTLADGRSIAAEQVVDAAGLQADAVARLAGDDGFAITPRKGQFLVTEETFGVDRIVLPVPGPMGKGMLVTPIIFGGVLLGPTARDVTDKDDRATDAEEMARIRASCAALVPAMAEAIPVRAFAGLRPVSSTGDYILRPSSAGDRLWLACGIRSTGISASPAVAEAVVAAVLAARGWRAVPPTRPHRPPPVEPVDLPGEVVCLCRGVSRGEIDSACRRPLAPLTLDGIKRRGGAMFGDCQGNLCAVGVAAILAEARGVGVETIERGPIGSWMFAGRLPTTPPVAPPPPDLDEDVEWDLIVVGAGHAGAAAAASARDGGSRVVTIDRADGWTAIGLLPDDRGWTVEVQRDSGAARLHGRSALLASGGFIEPREHRSIAGPRPAGVFTEDLVRAAIAAGLRPGRRAVVVGGTAAAAPLGTLLSEAGCEVVDRLDREPDEIRGTARLEAVRVGGSWIDADMLVLADRRLPQPFLLRGLGLIDARPGTRAPADRDGRLPLPGLWAAGCCVHPDIDHAVCTTAGAAVGRRIHASLHPVR